MPISKSIPAAGAALGGLLYGDDADALIVHKGVKGATEFAGHKRGDRKAPRIGTDMNGRPIGFKDMQERVEELKTALSKYPDDVETQSRLINMFVHNSSDYGGKGAKDPWTRAVGKADGGVNGPAYITGMDILAESLLKKLGDEYQPAIEDYARRRIGDAGKGRDASYGGEAGAFIGGQRNLSGTFDPLDKAAYDKSASNLPQRGGASLAIGTPSMGDDHLQATMHNREQKLNEHMSNLGLDKDPMFEYGSLLPVKQNIVTGESSLGAPEIVRDVMRGLLGLGMTPETGIYDPDNLLNTVL